MVMRHRSLYLNSAWCACLAGYLEALLVHRAGVLFWLAQATLPHAFGEDATECTNAGVVGDAGSTGTRIYVVHNVTRAPQIENIGKQSTGGLAKLGARQAFETGLGDLLQKAYLRLEQLGCAPPSGHLGKPTEKSASLPTGNGGAPLQRSWGVAPKLSILGTAGTRLMAPEKNAALWKELRALIQTMMHQKKLKFELLQLRTISGEEEGLFAFYSVNLLRHAVSHELRAREKFLHGVVDLGGASTQVAVPMRHITEGTKITAKDVFIRSFLGYGTKEFLGNAPSSVKDSCQFGKPAADCQSAIKAVFAERQVSGTSYVRENLSYFGKGDLALIQEGDQAMASVYTISGYYFAAQFLRWVGALQTPDEKLSLEQLAKGANAACATPGEEVQKKFEKEEKELVKHTTQQQLMTRCFDVCYAVVLLKEVYRWAADTPKFHFTDNVAGNSVDWALGAYISLVANGRGSSSSSAAVNPSDRESSSYWLPNLFAAALVSGFLLWLFRKMVWKTASGEDRTMGNSVNDMSQFSSKDIEAGWDDELRGLSSSGTKELPDLVGNTLVPNRSY